MTKSLIHHIFALIALSMLWSCDDKIADDSTAADATLVNLTIVHPDDLEADATVDHEHIEFYNISNGRTSEFGSGTEIRLTPGLYDIDYTAQVHSSSGSTSTLRATARSIQIGGDMQTVQLQSYNTIESDDLIIAEIFFAGTMRSSGNQYYGDDYIKLYNNTDHTVYADGLTLFETKFTTTDKS